MDKFFDAAAGVDRNAQTELRVDMTLAYTCMGAGYEGDREYLSGKYGRPTKTVGELNSLASYLFSLLDEEERATDLYMIERSLHDLELAAAPEYP